MTRNIPVLVVRRPTRQTAKDELKHPIEPASVMKVTVVLAMVREP